MSDGALIEGFFDAASGTVSYVLADPTTGRAAVVDPVLGFDYRSGTTVASRWKRHHSDMPYPPADSRARPQPAT